ncbi:MAG: glycosyltransferase family 1 protein [Prolixibacteraceae bacterium]|jgi:glycosyltransferase involved in cell wall biosynthesis
MIIGFDAKRAFNNAAGLGNFSRNTIRALSRQFPNDRYFLFHPGNSNPLFIPPVNSSEVKPNSILWKTLKYGWRSFRVGSIAKKLKLDIYHGLSHELPIWIENSNIRTVVTIHDLIYLRHPEYYHRIDRKIYDQKFRHACKVATKIHAISEQTKQDLMTYFFVPEEKIRVIYQSINPVFFEKSDEAKKQELRLKYQLPPRFVLHVGTVEPRKNLLGLLEGMIQTKTYIPVVVVGKLTDYQQKVQKFIEADLNRLEVFFLSRIHDPELAVLYQMAEVMVYPSFFEGFGLPVAEAQASGCPVITSFTSSLPEVGGEAAIYVSPEKPEEIGAALASLLADRNLRESMIGKGITNAQRFTPANFARHLKQLYNSVLE